MVVSNSSTYVMTNNYKFSEPTNQSWHSSFIYSQVFQRRSNGSEQFRRGWASYRRGFGSPQGEFWLGLDRLHRLTYQDEYELRVDMSDFDNIAVYAGYTWFRVDDTASNYRLHVGEYHGIAGESIENMRIWEQMWSCWDD